MKFSIFKFQFSISKGYTLVELLVVTAIIVIISGLIAGVLFSTLRGGSKSKTTNDVSQNGNYALSIISNTALLAEAVTKIDGNEVVDCTTARTGKSIEFQKTNGTSVQYTCDRPTQSLTSTENGVTTPLVNNGTVRVNYSSCSFTCFQSNNNPYALPIIEIKYTVLQRSTTAANDNSSRSKFETSVTMRNYSPK